jgi:hypothetical protein
MKTSTPSVPMNKSYFNRASVAILDDCYHLTFEYLKVKFNHNFREANSVAHELARPARESDQQVWLDEPPSSIVPLFISDVTSILNE